VLIGMFLRQAAQGGYQQVGWLPSPASGRGVRSAMSQSQWHRSAETVWR
jgi:hypothetical protein